MAIEACTSTVKTEVHNYTGRVDVVPPQELKAQLDFSEVGVYIGVWADSRYCAVPDAFC